MPMEVMLFHNSLGQNKAKICLLFIYDNIQKEL